MAKTYSDWGDKAKHSISFAQHKKNVAAKAGGGGGGGSLPSAERVTARAKKDPKFLARALKNPGLRSRITDTSLLPRDNPRAPLFAGSTLSNQDLAAQAAAETAAEYAGQEGDLAAKLKAAQQHQGDVDTWWQQYQAAVNSGAGAIGAAQDQMVAGAQGVTQGITGLGQAQIGGILDKAAATAGPGAAPSTSLATEANRAQVSRETLAASYLGQAQQQAAASKGFADYQAGVVAPAYRMLGRNETQRDIDAARAQQTTLATKKGAELLKNRADIRQQDLANVVALGQLSNQSLTAATSAAGNTPAGAAAKTAATEEAKMASKYGLTVHQWRTLGPNGRAARIKSFDKKAGTTTKVNKYGYPDDVWAGMSTAERRRIMGEGVPGQGGKDGKNGKGDKKDWATPGQLSAVLTQAAQLKNWAMKAKAGQPFVKGHGKPKPLPRNGPNSASAKIQENFGGQIKDPIILTAVLDVVYNNGVLSAPTVKTLIARGYKPSQVAQALGGTTAGKAPKRRAPTPGVVGQAGDTAARTVKGVV